jgi:hypothetical protein
VDDLADGGVGAAELIVLVGLCTRRGCPGADPMVRGGAAKVVLPPMAQRQNSRSANRGGAVVLQVMRVLFLDECNAHFIAVHAWTTVDV